MTRNHPRRARGFSLIEVLIALAITATLLTATLSALDASFKSYKATTESASTHVIARIVMQRITGMIRTGEEFGPYPVNPITDPIITSDYIEFVSFDDPATGVRKVTALISRDGDEAGTFELWYRVITFTNGAITDEREAPLLDGLKLLNFELQYDVGPRLRRVTIDMVIEPEDLQAAAIASGLETSHIRLVASASPRRMD